MPLEASAFPQEVQVAFFMFDLLPDRWDGNSGLYMGKDWAAANFLFDLYGFEEKTDIVYFMKIYENFEPSKINTIFIVRQNGRTG